MRQEKATAQFNAIRCVERRSRLKMIGDSHDGFLAFHRLAFSDDHFWSREPPRQTHRTPNPSIRGVFREAVRAGFTKQNKKEMRTSASTLITLDLLLSPQTDAVLPHWGRVQSGIRARCKAEVAYFLHGAGGMRGLAARHDTRGSSSSSSCTSLMMLCTDC
ncbi:unnamed protein product [Scytosiphon promiscuus]